MGRAPCCDKANVKRGPWSPAEDSALRSYIEKNGSGSNWISLPHKAGLRRCGKSCRLRWLNYLRPNIKHGGFTEEEDNIIYTLYDTIGSRWSVIASHLPGRTDNDVKNYWNTRLKKRLMAAATAPELTPTNIPSSSSSSSDIHSPSMLAAAPSLPPFAPAVKTEDFSPAPCNWSSIYGLDSYSFFPDFPPLPMPACLTVKAAEIVNPTPDDSSVASSSVENWSANGSSRDDPFLSEFGFDSYSEFLAGYAEVAPSAYSSSLVPKPEDLHQRIT